MEYLTDEDYEIAAKNGICKKTAYSRFYQNGWTKEKTITTPVPKRRTYPKEWVDLAKKNGISKNLFIMRIRKGLTYEEAATLEIVKEGSFSERSYEKRLQKSRGTI